MPRCALLLEYDGTNYAGWQRQPNARTVQEVIEHAIERVVCSSVHVVCSGRTDAGVHGFGQVAHVDIPRECHVAEHRLARAFNAFLPDDIRIRAARIVAPHFHARFDAVQREYRYTIRRNTSVFQRHYAWQPSLPFDTELLNPASSVFIGRHDFTAFSKHNPETESYICTVTHAAWFEQEQGSWCFRIIADRFVYGMVRAIVGAIMYTARGKQTIEALHSMLCQCRRIHTIPLAPPQGLVLWRVTYPEELFEEHHQA
ncbi:MAG: tRNA pseudouridine(38-40) synthase TruA [Bacteroidota bacterium]|nr:tRNA pseudouridine(38-40) synthase TruA [Candidatus Kapabacteria bacterium]MDW8220819.1 tRNA pseudouridine(38-40) synthase TruA [Bacteroidota bacterium]